MKAGFGSQFRDHILKCGAIEIQWAGVRKWDNVGEFRLDGEEERSVAQVRNSAPTFHRMLLV